MGIRSKSNGCYNFCCCCCVPLKVGVIILAIFGILGGGYQAWNTLKGIVSLSLASEEDRDSLSENNIFASLPVLYARGIQNVIQVIVSIVLIIGAIKQMKGLLMPYLIYSAIYMAMLVALAIYFIVWGVDLANRKYDDASMTCYIYAGAFLFTMAVMVHFWLVVCAYYEELRDGPINNRRYGVYSSA